MLETSLTLEEAKAIAKEAAIYAYPMAENYLSIYQFALNPEGADYKGPPNAVHNVARVFGPQDTGVVTPNSDTPYSFLIMDLRTEPIVVTMPPIEENRYYSHQLVDLYTYNFAYTGTRVDGNEGGDFLVAGPNWRGTTPASIRRVMRADTNLLFSQFRTQLLDAADLDNVKRIQDGYSARPLSVYLDEAPPDQAPAIDFPAITRDQIDPSLFSCANFLLQFCPVLPSEEAMRERFARIGIAPGAPWPPPNCDEDLLQAIAHGQEEGMQEVAVRAAAATSSLGFFGTREELAGKYLERAAGAMMGLYGNSAEEALYPAYQADANGESLDSGQSLYTLTFLPHALPPVDAFWSVTMYDGATRYLIDNPLDRYLINSPMLPELQRNPDGGLTLYLQHESPGPSKEANWLPAPDGPMFVVMRLYLPKIAVLAGDWQAPPILKAGPA